MKYRGLLMKFRLLSTASSEIWIHAPTTLAIHDLETIPTIHKYKL